MLRAGWGNSGRTKCSEVIGRGGMGVVLRAHDSKLNRMVAIKVLAPQLAANATARKRFLREAQAGPRSPRPRRDHPRRGRVRKDALIW